MANTIDNRIVSLQFDNAQFEKGVATTTQSLVNLNKSLQLNGAAGALQGVGAAASGASGPLSGMAAGVESIASKFNILGAIGFTVIQSLTRGFMNLAGSMFSAIATPIIQGGEKRALSIEQAKFQFDGLKMNVKDTMGDALYAVKDTAFGLDEAARAASMFGASGLRAGKDMRAALRGISGVAALSGSSYADISDIFTKIAGQGRLMGEDLLRLSSRGVNAAAILGKAMGKPEAEIRKMVTHGEISFKQFSKIMDDTFGPHAKEANKTFQGALANTKTALARLGAVYYGGSPNGTNKGMHEAMRIAFVALIPIIDNVTTALTPFIDLVTTAMQNGASAFSAFLDTFKKTDGIETFGHISQGFVDLFYALQAILRPIGKAFLEVFPPVTAKNTHAFAEAFQSLMNKLFPSKETIQAIGIAFKGLFSAFKLAGQSIKFVFDVFVTIFDVLLKASGITGGLSQGLGGITTSIAGFFTSLSDGADKSKFFSNTLESLRTTLQKLSAPFKFVGDSIKFLVGWFGNFIGAGRKLNGGFAAVSTVANFLAQLIDQISKGLNYLSVALKPVGDALKRAFNSITIEKVMQFMVLLFSGAMVSNVSKFTDRILAILRTFVPNFNKLAIRFGAILNSLSAQVNAQTLKTIANAVLVLAAAAFIISMIDPKRLASSMAGIAAMVSTLLIILKNFGKIAGSGNEFKGIVEAVFALNLLSGALILMSIAVLSLGSMKPETLAKGLGAVAVLLTSLDLFVHFLDTDKKLVGVGFGMVLFGVALLLMGAALNVIGKMDTGSLVQAMVAIGGLFAFVLVVNKLIKPSEVAKVGLDMIMMAGSIMVMGTALKLIGGIPLAQLLTGLLGLAAGLTIMVATLHLLPQDSKAKAMDLIIVAGAVYILSLALVKLGSISGDQMITALLGLALSLAAVSQFLQQASDPQMLVGAASLLVVSVALVIFAQVLKTIGAMPIDAIAKGMVVVGVALGILIIAGLLLNSTGAVEGLLGLGLAILMIGSAVFLAAIGIGLLVLGIGLLVTAVAAGGAGMVAVLVLLSAQLPVIATNIATSIGAFALGLVGQQQALTSALVMLFNTVLDAMTTIMPKVLKFISDLITGILTLLVQKTPQIITALLILLADFMNAIQKNLPGIIKQAGNIVVSFINGMADYDVKIVKAGADFIIKLMRGIGNQALRIADAAMKVVIKFINGLTTAINKNGKAFDTAVKGLIDAIFSRAKALVTTGDYAFDKIAGHIIDGLTSGLKHGIDAVVKSVGGVIGAAYQAAKDAGWIKSPSKLFAKVGVWLIQGLAGGVDNTSKEAVNSAKNVIAATYSAMNAANEAANNILLGMDNPVIKPVIDLDSVHAGAKAIASLMGGTSSMNVAATVSGRLDSTSTTSTPVADNGPNQTVVNFNQTNNSPKALSRLDIYRQTHNQLRVLKGLGV